MYTYIFGCTRHFIVAGTSRKRTCSSLEASSDHRVGSDAARGDTLGTQTNEGVVPGTRIEDDGVVV